MMSLAFWVSVVVSIVVLVVWAISEVVFWRAVKKLGSREDFIEVMKMYKSTRGD